MSFAKFISTALVATTIMVSATPAISKDAKSDYVILKIGNDDIKYSKVKSIWTGLFPNEKAPDFDTMENKMKTNVLRGVASEHLIYKAANNSNIIRDSKVLASIEKLKKKVITQAYLEREADKLVPEGEIKKQYVKYKKETASKKEIKASHILVKTEAEAKELFAKIKKDGNFSELAKEKSIDTGTSKNGGELGYFTEDRMVPEFSKAAFALKKGETSKPVKTGFGWHIIKVTDKRSITPKSYDEMKQSIESKAKGDALEKFVQNMVDKANVQYFDASGKKLELTTTPDTTKK